MMKQLLTLGFICMLNFPIFSQFEGLMEQIDILSAGESFELKYTKAGDWGAYEGGKMIFSQIGEDSIKIELTNKQVYLGSEEKTTSTSYHKLELLETLLNNKNTYYKDPDNIVFNNRFYYSIQKDGEEITNNSLPMDPSDVVNPFSLESNLKNIFFKEEKKVFGKGQIKIN